MSNLRTIYEIRDDIASCYEEVIDPETGEILEIVADKDRLDALKIEEHEKFEAVGLWRKETVHIIDALKAEKRNIDKRIKQAENLAQSLDEYLSFHLDGEKFETPKIKIGFRKSDQIIVDDMAFIPDEYLKIAEPTVNKAALKKAIKAGTTVAGCHLEEKLNINYR